MKDPNVYMMVPRKTIPLMQQLMKNQSSYNNEPEPCYQQTKGGRTQHIRSNLV